MRLLGLRVEAGKGDGSDGAQGSDPASTSKLTASLIAGIWVKTSSTGWAGSTTAHLAPTWRVSIETASRKGGGFLYGSPQYLHRFKALAGVSMASIGLKGRGAGPTIPPILKKSIVGPARGLI